MQDPKQQQWLLEPGGIASRLRELQGKTPGVVFAERTGLRTTKISKLRLGQQLPTEDDILKWVAAAGAADSAAHELIAQLQDAESHHSSFQRKLRRGQARHQGDYNKLVEQARSVRMFERSFIPRLLQTFDYAEERLKKSAERHKGADDTAKSAATRLECQRFLYDGAHRFQFIIDEAVLTRGTPEIMIEQMDRLLQATEMPSVRLGLIPVHGAPVNDLLNSFELYGRLCVVETYYNDDAQTDDAWHKYDETMRKLWQDAVEGAAARKLIENAKAYHAGQTRQPRKRKGKGHVS